MGRQKLSEAAHGAFKFALAFGHAFFGKTMIFGMFGKAGMARAMGKADSGKGALAVQ